MKNLNVLLIIALLLASVLVAEPKRALAKEPSDQGAQMAQADPLKDIVLRSELIALGTITAKSYDTVAITSGNTTTGTFTYTIFTLQVEQIIKGDASLKEISIKLAGGLTQSPLQAYFSVSDRMLLSLVRTKDGYFIPLHTPFASKYADGVLWINGPKLVATVPLAEIIGRVVRILRVNSIPLAFAKTRPLPAPAAPVIRPKQVPLPTMQPPKPPTRNLTPEQQARLDLGWEYLMTEGFESGFPTTGWTVAGNPTWDEDDYRSYGGSLSAWCAKGGTNGVDPQYNNYPNFMQDPPGGDRTGAAWMTYGPFDLSLASAANCTFNYWLNTEEDYDWFMWLASTDGTNFYGDTVSGLAGDQWYEGSLDLSNVPDGLGGHINMLGDSSVYIAFIFTSDGSVNYKGVFVDDIVLEQNIAGPEITVVNPSSAPAGTGTANIVTITGHRFGPQQSSTNNVTFFYKSGLADAVATIQSWANEEIHVYVPADYATLVTASSGNITVNTDRGAAKHDFTVTYSYSGAKWKKNGTLPIIVKFNVNTTGAPDGALDAIDRASDTWNSVYGANYRLERQSNYAWIPQHDTINEIGWAYDLLPPGYAAGSPAYRDDPNDSTNITECDLIFNRYLNWSTTNEVDKYDVQNVATHEFGHWLFLLDLYGGTDQEKTMWGQMSSINETKKQTLTSYDEDGIKYIYPGEAPAVSTSSASSIGQSTATLNGDLTHKGTASTVSVSFEWGLTTSYGSTTSPENKSTTGSFNAPISGLTSSTTYHFRAKAVGDGTVYGEDQSFVTAASDTTPPSAVSNASAGTPTQSSLLLSWTAPGDDGNSGNATQYDIRYSTSAINDGNWDYTTNVTGEPTPLVAGSAQSMNITGLNSGTLYYFAMKTADEVPNWSSISNTCNGTTSSESIVGEVLRPTGAGSETSIDTQYPNSTSHWDKVDEASPDEDSTYIENKNGAVLSFQRDLFAIQNHSTGSGTISKVNIVVRTKVNARNDSAVKISLKTHGQVYDYDYGPYAQSYWMDLTHEMTVNPYTSAAWTWSEIDDMEAGVSLGGSDYGPDWCRCTQVYVVANPDYLPTPQEITLRPNGAGAETNFPNQYPSSGAHWDKVDEATPDATSTAIYFDGEPNSPYYRDLFALEDHSSETGAITSVTVCARVWHIYYITYAYLALRTGGTVYESDQKAISGGYPTYPWETIYYTWETNPNTGLAWTWSEIDGLQAGIRQNSWWYGWDNYGTAWTTQVYVIVDYLGQGSGMRMGSGSSSLSLLGSLRNAPPVVPLWSDNGTQQRPSFSDNATGKEPRFPSANTTQQATPVADNTMAKVVVPSDNSTRRK